MLSNTRKKITMAKPTYSNVNLFFRSLIFSIYSLTSIILYGAFFTLVGWPLPVKTRHKLIRFYLTYYFRALKLICHMDYKIIGLENIPPDRTGIFMSKHQSTWETFMLPLIFDTPAIITKRELLWIPFFGWGLALADPIAINRKDRTTAMQQVIAKGTQCLKDGRWIMVFPEGTRTAYGTVGNYRLGGARLAVATQHPILPIAHNAGYFWPRRKFIKRPGTVTMVIGPLIETQGLTPEQAMAKTKDWIETTMATLKVD